MHPLKTKGVELLSAVRLPLFFNGFYFVSDIYTKQGKISKKIRVLAIYFLNAGIHSSCKPFYSILSSTKGAVCKRKRDSVNSMVFYTL